MFKGLTVNKHTKKVVLILYVCPFVTVHVFIMMYIIMYMMSSFS